GYYLEASYQYFGKSLGSGFEYSKIFIDAVKYLRIYEHHIIAINFVSDNTIGNPPFNQLALLGGTKRMRGYYEGRFRDKNMLIMQAEYRTSFFGRLGGTIFGGIGEVTDHWVNYNFKNVKYSYGAGLRVVLDKKEKINLRLDFAFGQNTQGLYLTIGEAF
ncbi:MAG: BamA/TamA family outer membrane protein, partial [Bacteroidetes bacterium]|nr:BamA/TamA family outer membrane protein [Bacteroidota bacterium]